MSIKKIVIVQHTHTDIGYTGTYPQVTAQHVRHFRTMLELCKKDRRFLWTIESSWTLDTFLSAASKTEKNQFLKYIRNGQIEMMGFYDQPFPQLCNLEELCASLELTFRLTRGMGAKIETVMINDVAGMSYNFPQIGQYYGIRHIINGSGQWRLMFPYTTLPRMFYLTGPDGSKVLYYHLGDDVKERFSVRPGQYGMGLSYFLWPMLREIDGKQNLVGNDGEKTVFNMQGREGIDKLCQRFEREGYPYDTLLMQIGADNYGPFERLLEAIDMWNQRYGEPQIVLGSCHGFFADIEKRYKKVIPSVQGEITCAWSEHAITNASATGRYREARRRLFGWSVLNAAMPKLADTSGTWWQVMKNLVMYSDHCWGLAMWLWEDLVAEYGSFWHEVFDLPRYSWQTKSRNADDALNQISEAQDQQSIELSADDMHMPRTLSIFNPHSFSAGGIVKFVTNQPAIELVDHSGAPLNVESHKINTKDQHLHKVWIDKFPSYSLAVYQIREVQTALKPCYTCENWTLKGPSITVQIDPTTGSISSVKTAKRSNNWVDPSNGHLNEAFYFMVEGVAPGNVGCGLEEKITNHRLVLKEVKKAGHTEGVCSVSMVVERRFEQDGNTVLIETQYILDGSGIRIRNRVRKIHTIKREACYFAFPFNMKTPYRFDVEQQGQITQFPDERLPGSSNHNFGVQDFISISDKNSQIVLTTLQACLVALGQPSYYHFGLDYQQIKSPTVFSYAFNNLWNTNCSIHQHGDLMFEYHLAFIEKSYSPVAAYQSSRQAAQPCTAFIGDLRSKGFQTENTNLLTLSTDTVLAESIRPEAAGVWQIRLAQISRENTACEITLCPGRFKEYCIRKYYNETPKWQRIVRSPIKLKFQAAEFKTLLLKG